MYVCKGWAKIHQNLAMRPLRCIVLHTELRTVAKLTVPTYSGDISPKEIPETLYEAGILERSKLKGVEKDIFIY
jgi:hypothetical protein